MRKSFWSLVGLTASLLAGSSMAQTSSSSSSSWLDSFDAGGSWYVGAKIGGNWMARDVGVRTNAFAAPIEGSATFNDGYIGAIQGGYAFNSGISFEIEGADRYNAVSRVHPYTGNGRGALQNYAVMGNAFFNIPLESFGLTDMPITPFVGLGIGVADAAPHNIRADGMPYPAYIGGNDRWGFAYQAIAGLSHRLTDDIDLSVEYRYFNRNDENNPRGITTDYGAHSALLGIKYSFGRTVSHEEVQQTPYVAPPVPRPAVPSRYLVFFDFNKSDLTSDARRIVDTAATNAKNTKVTRLEVTGYTDTVGSDAYNMRLSRRRAESVSAELQALGVPASDIAIFARGKHDLLVPTADGVKEPQNRRVQIIYTAGSEANPSS
jgi:OOP family OmpA-OmpF porin